MLQDIDLNILAAFTVLWAAIVPTPGANALMVTHVALTGTRWHMALAILGNVTGIALMALAALLGMGALLEALPWLRLAVNILGAAYLVWLGTRLLLSSRRPAPEDASGRSGAAMTGRSAVVLGFVTALSNAPAIVFLTSIFAVAGILTANLATGLACISAIIVLNAGYLAGLGSLFQLPGPRRAYQHFRRVIEASVGVLFIGLGLRLIYKALPRG